MSRKRCIRKHYAKVDPIALAIPVPCAPEVSEACVYVVLCEANGRFYIGSSKSVAKRFRDHFLYLRTKRHENPKLQAAFNKYGQESFRFFIVEHTAAEDCRKREQAWLDAWRAHAPEKLLNLVFSAIAPPTFYDLTTAQQDAIRASVSRRSIAMHQDPEFAARRDERMKLLNANPAFAKANTERARLQMKRLNADGAFKQAMASVLAAGGRKVMLALHQQPEFQARHLTRVAAINADPVSRARCVVATKAANSKPCTRELDGVVSAYPSVRSAADVLGLPHRVVGAWCRGEKRPTDGAKWGYV